MPDYGHELAFGTFLTPSADNPARVVALAQLTEQLGLELASFQDHPYQARHLDTWTLLSVVAARTTELRVSPNVANVPLRPPLVLARSAASLDLLSNGRVELGLGAGAFWDAIAAAGGPRLSAPEGVRSLAEAIEVIRASWDTTQRAIRVDGEFHRILGAHPGPAPAHDIGIWLGAYRPRMLELTGRVADGWLPSSMYAAPDTLADGNARIDEAALRAGRRPHDVRRLYNVVGSFTEGGGADFLRGPAAVWAEQLAGLALDEGIGTFILGSDDPDQIRRFAGEVVPAVRELVEAERISPPKPEPATVSSGRSSVPTPTPDDGVRRSSERLWDDSGRPAGPPTDPDRPYTAHQQAAGQALVDVHDHLRAELIQVLDLVEQVAAGQLSVATARSTINDMTMRQNNWTLGTYCESYCRLVATHHTIEDRTVFPHLRRAEPGLVAVVDRLEEEHRVIHDVLERVDRALVALVSADSDPDRLDDVRAAVDVLSDTLLSHLSYEERELVEPLSRLGFS